MPSACLELGWPTILTPYDNVHVVLDIPFETFEKLRTTRHEGESRPIQMCRRPGDELGVQQKELVGVIQEGRCKRCCWLEHRKQDQLVFKLKYECTHRPSSCTLYGPTGAWDIAQEAHAFEPS